MEPSRKVDQHRRGESDQSEDQREDMAFGSTRFGPEAVRVDGSAGSRTARGSERGATMAGEW